MIRSMVTGERRRGVPVCVNGIQIIQMTRPPAIRWAAFLPFSVGLLAVGACDTTTVDLQVDLYRVTDAGEEPLTQDCARVEWVETERKTGGRGSSVEIEGRHIEEPSDRPIPYANYALDASGDSAADIRLDIEYQESVAEDASDWDDWDASDEDASDEDAMLSVMSFTTRELTQFEGIKTEKLVDSAGTEYMVKVSAGTCSF